jgi:hypothetical protein
MCTAAAVKIGTESTCDFRNITVTGCTVEHSSRGLSIQLRDQGSVENIVFTATTIQTRLFDDHYWGKSEPVHISVLHRFPLAKFDEGPEWNRDNRLGTVRNVIFSDLICNSENGIFIYGEEAKNVGQISLRNIRLNISKWTKWAGGFHDLRPCTGHGRGAIESGKTNPAVFEHPWSAVYLQNAWDIGLQNISVKWKGQLPDYYRHALQGKNVQSLRLSDFTGRSPHPSIHPAINLDKDCRIKKDHIPVEP